VIARYKRMCGYDVAYLTGTDEHGVNIERAAEKAGVTPQQLVDKNEKIFRDLWKLLGITTTDFIRTTSDDHARAVQTLVRRTMDRDKALPPEKRSIYKARYEGRYCIYDNLYVTDTPEPANCQICGRPAELISEENYFFKLSNYQDRLLDLYKTQPQFVQPDFRRNEVMSFVESGLKDVSISRKTIKWGIPWPGDPDHVFYVWYDALTSYLSGIGYASENAQQQKKFAEFWPAQLHMIGKEIIRFHAVYWPAFLMAAELPLPKQIFAHGWLLFEQEKMSKSKGNVAYAEPIVKTLGNDALRYYLLREVVFGQDGNFSREALITRYNADLANGLGNLASRTLAMVQQSLGGTIPAGGSVVEAGLSGLPDEANNALALISAKYLKFDFMGLLADIWSLIGQVDLFLTARRPWAKPSGDSDEQSRRQTLHDAVQALYLITAMAHPVIPEATQKIWEQLGQTEKLENVRIDQLTWGGLKPGTKIGKIEGVFPRADKKETLEKIETMENELRNSAAQAAAAAPEPKPSAPPTTEADVPSPSATAPAAAAAATAPAAAPSVPVKIGIEDFAKVELRVGVVKSAEKIQGADKLLKLLVDIGDEVRQVLAGIAMGYTPEELVGRKVVVVTNLAPRKMRGLESNGMLLAASAGPDGKPVLCTFAEDIPVGSKVK
jgi:methionyl-tRNA synthetase